MKNQFFFALLALLLLNSCTKEGGILAPDPLTVSRKITNEWSVEKGTGGGNLSNYLSPRNHYYDFKVSNNNQPVDITLSSSDIAVGFQVFDELWQSKTYTYAANTSNEKITLNAGIYHIVVFSGKRYDIGKYTLTILGIPNDPTLLTTNWIKTEDKNFGEYGGGGYDVSARNHLYSFEVLEDNTYIDVDVNSKDADTGFTIYDYLEKYVDGSGSSRTPYAIKKLNKGKYTLWVSTRRNDRTSYKLNITGKVANLQQKVFNYEKITGTYSTNKDEHTYTINITEDNAYIDLTLLTSFGSRMELISPEGKSIYTAYGSDIYRKLSSLKGVFKVKVSAYSSETITTPIPYTLLVSGSFDKIQKQ